MNENAVAQQLPRSEFVITLTRENADSSFQLPHQFIATKTDSVVVDSAIMLRPGFDYFINERLGQITFDSSFTRQLLSDSLGQHRIVVYYQYFPFKFQESYFRRRLLVLKDSTGRDTLRVSKPRASFGLDDIFGQNLQKSGSIVRGFTVGSNRDFTLNSGLRLQLAGKISNDIEVVAALTDENTPIQPEGTSQTLQEFDKVFVELRSTDVTTTLGDFNIDLGGTEFAGLSRKLQGAKATANYRFGFSNGSVMAAAASTRGKFNTNQFQGLEAVQGPYRLVGKENERQIIVIAGTERVYVNGEQQTRGETNDYTIDYSNGEITFTTRRLITSASRITVDFEYSDRQFSRSMITGQSSSSFFDNRARLTLSFIQEADDPESPIDFSLTDSARAILANAGDDRSKATTSSIVRVDSNGYYVIDSTVIGGTKYVYYRYAPGRDANYVIGFSYVGFGKGEYIRQAVGVFTWRGPGAGDYLPLTFVPLPQLAQVMDANLDLKPTDDLRIAGELGVSRFDANRLSGLDDFDNRGHALSFLATYAPKNVTFGETNIGSFDVRLKERFVNKRFVSVDRTNDIEFSRKWGIESASIGDEETQEASLGYAPSTGVSLRGGYGKITRGDQLRSVRNDASLSIKADSLPTVQYFLEEVRTRESPSDNNSKWLRHNGIAEYKIGMLTPFFRFEGENRRITSLSTDSLKNGSFKFNVFSPGLMVRDFAGMMLSASLEWRTEDRFLNGSLLRESRAFTQAYAWKLSEWNTLSSSIDVTLRDKKYTQAFRAIGNNDLKTVLVRNQTRFAPLNRGLETDLFYEVSTERSSRLERVFVRVPVGTGNYKYLGDLNSNGVAEENEFVLTRFDGDYISVTVPSDEFFPVIDLKTSARVRITPSRFLTRGNSGLEDVLSIFSSETYIRLEEKSTESDLKKIYLLHFSRFQSDSTIAGSTLFTQDLHLFEGKPDLSARLRFSQRKGLNKFASSTSSGTQERSYTRERSVRLRWQLISEIANQIDFVNRIDRITASELSSRAHDIVSNSVVFDLSYRPYQNVEMGMKFETGKSTDRHIVPALEADLNSQSLRFVYAFQGFGQARVEASREEVLLSATAETFPYELTGGRVAGKTYIWRAAFDYRVTQFIQASLNYDGRTEGGRSPIHTAHAEVRAFF
ncbi:MAG: hypothetical protein HY961_07425 [Ignavibacteriae bacterium]|nr:hypothetical protein [Ignavibacteriota bacterium]